MANPEETHHEVDKNGPTIEIRAKSRSGVSLIYGLLYVALGVLIGVLVAENIYESLPSILPNLMAIFIAFFVLILLLILALPIIFRWITKRYTGKELSMEEGLSEVQAKTNHIADAVVSSVLTHAESEVKQNIRHDLPIIMNYLIFARMRNVGLRYLMMVFIAIGGLMGTIVLYNQNQLLTKQNEKIDNQILLDEASRRSSLNFLMANVLDKVDEELKKADRDSMPRRLSSQLVGRIASLSQSFRPYRFVENGEMLNKEYSPERGNLLVALINSNMDTVTLDTIFKRATFASAYLNGAMLFNAYLKGINLRGASCKGANLISARIGQSIPRGLKEQLYKKKLGPISSDVSKHDFIVAGLKSVTDLRETDFNEANLSNADLNFANLTGSSLIGAKLENTELYFTILSNVDLKEAEGLNKEMLMYCLTRDEIKNLPDSLKVLFMYGMRRDSNN